MTYWLIKSEPETFSLDDFRKEQVTVWYGVRNYAARNNLRTMQFGDICIFYRSVTKPAAIALCKVVREHYPDPTAEGDKADTWSAVDVAFVSEFAQEVSLSKIKEMPELQNMALLRLSRLSVQPVTAEEFEIIMALSKG